MDRLTIIRDCVCQFTEVQDIQTKSRKIEIVRARQLCYYFARKFTKLSFSDISAAIGGKDHATAIHGCKTINNLIDTDKIFAAEVSYIKDFIQGHINESRHEVTLILHLRHAQFNGINYQYHINNELRFSDIPMIQVRFDEVHEANRALKMDEVSSYEIQVKVMVAQERFKPENKMEAVA